MSEPSQRSALWGSLELAFELGYLIAIPIVLLGLGGRFLDRWLGTSPWLLLAGVLLAIVLSSIGIARKIRTISRAEFSEEAPKDDRQKTPRV
ncbi:MAG: AtpZ/AtpI family protein [bacterium]|nr:AtpZ/AtpI family protein [bacterium]